MIRCLSYVVISRRKLLEFDIIRGFDDNRISITVCSDYRCKPNLLMRFVDDRYYCCLTCDALHLLYTIYIYIDENINSLLSILHIERIHLPITTLSVQNYPVSIARPITPTWLSIKLFTPICPLLYVVYEIYILSIILKD